jgi:hypothetical protein
MQVINVIVRHYAQNKNGTCRIFYKEPNHFPDLASSLLVRLYSNAVGIIWYREL